MVTSQTGIGSTVAVAVAVVVAVVVVVEVVAVVLTPGSGRPVSSEGSSSGPEADVGPDLVL